MTRRKHPIRNRKSHSAPSRAARRQNYHRGLFLERLEDRTLMAMVSHWTADNTSDDAVGTNHGTLVSGATYAPGQINQAFSFDGINDRVIVADSPSLALTHSMTIEGWIKVNAISPTTGGVILFRGDDRGGLDPYVLSVDPDRSLKFGVNPITNQGVSITAPIVVGQFIHVAGTLDDATGAMKLYQNGVLMAQTVTTARPFANLDPASNPGVGIGNHGGFPTTPHNFPFNGLIDELTLYDHALTAADVLAIYEAGKGNLQPGISIANVSATEGETTTFLVDEFVPSGSDGLNNGHQAAFAPNGDLYVTSGDTDSVLRYSSAGTFLGTVIPASAGLDFPWGLTFGPDGKLYVAGRRSDNIVTYDPATEAVATLIAPGNGLWAPVGMAFGADGHLYVANSDRSPASPHEDQVRRFAGPLGGPLGEAAGTPLGVLIPAGSGGASALDNPNHLAFQGNYLYVTNTRGDSVNRYHAATGAFDKVFVTPGSGGLDIPNFLWFHTDGLLYVVSQGTRQVLRYDGTTGELVDVFVPAQPAGASSGSPMSISLGEDGRYYVPYYSEVLRYDRGQVAQFTVTVAPSPGSVSVDFATADIDTTMGSDYTPVAGTLTFAPGEMSKSFTVPIKNDLLGEPTESFVINLANAAGGKLLDDEAIGTIVDDDPGPTKFFVVNDGSPDRTYEYGPQGKALENYAINAGNTIPRGAASTIAGDKVWVVDVNKKVYVYNTSGGLLGSWTAGGLTGNPQLEGIATNGVDVWLVDNKSDKVFRYANAAGRLSGTQNAASSFALYYKGPFSPDYNNRNPKDIVTDGTHLWVLNDGVSEDKLFKYTLSGTAVWQNGWTLDPLNSQPTGVTLDPANPYDFWIVDAGTRRVYRYAGAVLQAGGGLAHPATDSFALASGNTNPQGIADPPVPGDASGAVASEPSPLVPGLSVDHVFASAPAETRGASPIPAARELRARPHEVGRRLREAAADETSMTPAKEARPMETAHAQATDLVLADLMEGEGLFGGVRKKRR